MIRNAFWFIAGGLTFLVIAILRRGEGAQAIDAGAANAQSSNTPLATFEEERS